MNNDKLHTGEIEGGEPRLVLASPVGLNQGDINVNYGVNMGESLTLNLIVLSDTELDDDLS